MKVWGGLYCKQGVDKRGVLCTSGMKHAQEILTCSRGFFKSYWNDTVTEQERAIATLNPHKVCIKMDDGTWWYRDCGEWHKAIGGE